MIALSLRMPLRFLRGSAVRLALTVMALACSVALVCAIDLANRAVYQAFVEVVDTMAGRASLQVTAGDTGLIAEEVADAVSRVPGVELAVPVVSASAFLTDGSGQQLTVHGVDIASEAAVRVYEPESDQPVLDDPLAFLAQPDSIMLTREFATSHGLAQDDPIELQTPTGRRRFIVRALLAPHGIARVQGGHLVLMDIQAAERAFTSPGLVSRIDVVVEREASVQSVHDALIAALPPGLRVEAPAQRKVNLQQVMRAVQTLMTSVSVFGIIAAFLIAFSRLNTVFEARAWQLAVLRAAGVRAGAVWWELAKEGLVLGVAGVGIGIPAGIALGRALLPVIAQTTALSAKLIATEPVLHVRLVSVLLAAGLGIVAVLLAAALPAWRGAQVAVAETLRHRDIERAEPTGSGGLVARLVLGACTAAIVVVHLISEDPATGLLASGLIVFTAALLARPLLALLERPLETVVPQLAGPTGRLAVAALLKKPRRTALAIATLGVGFGTVLWLWVMAASFERSVLEVMPQKLRGDLSISSANVDAGYVEAPMDGALIDELRRVPGVDIAIGERAIDWQYAGGPIAIDALDPAYFTDARFGGLPLAGRRLPDAMAAVARGEAVIVSDNFVRNLRVGVGDLLTLDTPRGPLTLRIAGMSPDFLSPRGTVNLSRDLFRSWWHDDKVVRGLVRVTPETPLETVRRDIAARLGVRYNLRVLTLRALIDWFAEQVERAFSALHILAGLVLLVVLAGVGDTLAATTLERTREFGVARAVGVRRRVLSRTVVLEASLLGVLGLGLAWGIGIGLGALWVKATFPSLLGWTLQLYLPVWAVAGVGVAVLGVCLLASYLPAAHAGRLDPVVALRAE